MTDTDNVHPLRPGMPAQTSGFGNGGNGSVDKYRIGELERRMGNVESKLEQVNTNVIEIKSNSKNIATKNYVIWLFVGSVVLSLSSAFIHVAIRLLTNTP